RCGLRHREAVPRIVSKRRRRPGRDQVERQGAARQQDHRRCQRRDRRLRGVCGRGTVGDSEQRRDAPAHATAGYEPARDGSGRRVIEGVVGHIKWRDYTAAAVNGYTVWPPAPKKGRFHWSLTAT